MHFSTAVIVQFLALTVSAAPNVFARDTPVDSCKALKASDAATNSPGSTCHYVPIGKGIYKDFTDKYVATEGNAWSKPGKCDAIDVLKLKNSATRVGQSPDLCCPQYTVGIFIVSRQRSEIEAKLTHHQARKGRHGRRNGRRSHPVLPLHASSRTQTVQVDGYMGSVNFFGCLVYGVM